MMTYYTTLKYFHLQPTDLPQYEPCYTTQKVVMLYRITIPHMSIPKITKTDKYTPNIVEVD